MAKEGHLVWVQRNAQRTERMRAVGGPVTQILETIVAGAGVTAATVAAIADVVDEEFRSHCRLSVSGRGDLYVQVDSAPLVSLMQRRWNAVLTEALGQRPGKAKIRRIVFDYGHAGFGLPPACSQVNDPENIPRQ